MVHMEKAPPWSDEELGFLADHEHLSNRQLAEAIGRSAAAVKGKRRMLRRGWEPRIEFWSEDDDAFILETPHLTARQVSNLMSRTVEAVRSRRRMLAAVKGVKFEGVQISPSHIGSRPLLAKTCEECGLLLQADWYRHNRGPGKYWPKKCVRCAPPSGKTTDHGTPNETNERFQRLTKPHAHRAREPWLESDHVILKDPDMTLVEKSLTLGRTYYAVKSICQRDGYKSKVGLGDPERDVWIINNPNAPEQAA